MNESKSMTEIKDLVFVGEHDKVFTTSLKIAEVFGKEHSKVLRDIKNLIDADEEIGQANFGLSSYLSGQNKELPMYILDRDGFTLLVMGYTGKKALDFKKAYIKAFNAMEEELKRQQAQQRPLTAEEMFLQSAQIMLEQRKRLDNVESRLDKIENVQETNRKVLVEIKMSTEAVPEQTLRSKVNQIVRAYANSNGLTYKEVWDKVYSDLYNLYHINLSARKHRKGEKNIDVAERTEGCMEKLYNIVSNIARSTGLQIC